MSQKKNKTALQKQFTYDPIEDNEAAQKRGLFDPIGDKAHEIFPGFIHRYENRVLFLPTQKCVVNCRFCFRKNLLPEHQVPPFKKILAYLKKHKEVQEFIFSGGDPFTLSAKEIDSYLKELSKTQIRFIRFHTRVPVMAPHLLTPTFVAVLKKWAKHYTTLTVAIHSNHKDELTAKARAGIKKLQGLNLISQTVLLKGINDQAKTLADLFLEFVSLGIRPYYLHHADRVKGAMHFSLTIPQGRKIYAALRDLLPGWAIPHYVLDIPGGKGKTPLYNPEAYAFSGKLLGKNGKLVLTEQAQDD